jgi:hypothetical protein
LYVAIDFAVISRLDVCLLTGPLAEGLASLNLDRQKRRAASVQCTAIIQSAEVLYRTVPPGGASVRWQGVEGHTKKVGTRDQGPEPHRRLFLAHSLIMHMRAL